MPKYIPLQDIIDRTISTLHSGGSVLLSGHRRLGKTLLMQHIEKLQSLPFIPTYLIVESVDSVEEFYRKLVTHLSDMRLIDEWEKLGLTAKRWFKQVNVEELGANVRFGNPKEIDYRREFEQFLDKIENDRPIVLMLDEFPQVIENIRSMETQGEAQIRQLLTSLREIRQDPRFKTKIRFVLAGSIGLQNVVEGLGMTKHVNDLKEIILRPFSPEEADEYLHCLFSAKNLTATPALFDAVKQRIGRLTPYYLNLLVDELNSNEIDEGKIDQAFQAMLGQHINFESWHTRLKPQALLPKEYRFCKAVLNTASDPEKNKITRAELANFAVQFDVMDELNRLLAILVHDGYLAKADDSSYGFVSPVLQAWWWQTIAN